MFIISHLCRNVKKNCLALGHSPPNHDEGLDKKIPRNKSEEFFDCGTRMSNFRDSPTHASARIRCQGAACEQGTESDGHLETIRAARYRK